MQHNTKKLGSLLSDISLVVKMHLNHNIGVIFLSLLFTDAVENDTTSGETIKQATKDGIVALAKDLSVASFDVKFTDSRNIYKPRCFQFNFLTTLAENAIKFKCKMLYLITSKNMVSLNNHLKVIY